MKKQTFSKRTVAGLLVVVFAFCAVVARPGGARAIKLGDILDGDVGTVVKGVAVLALTSALAEQIDDLINTLTLNKGIPAQAATKVVPIVAMGSGTRVGAAQVSGPKDLVEKVKVVVQIETKLKFKNLDVEVFIPSDSLNPLKFNRVEGTGVSALIDLRASGL